MYCMLEDVEIPTYMKEKGDRREFFIDLNGNQVNVGDLVLYWHSSKWYKGYVFSCRSKSAYIAKSKEHIEKADYRMKMCGLTAIGNYETEFFSVHQGLIFAIKPNQINMKPLWDFVNIKSEGVSCQEKN